MRKNTIASFEMFDDTDISTNQTSNVTNVLNLDRGTIFLDWSGTSPDGTLEVQAKKHSAGSPDPESDYRALDFGSAITISGNSGSHIIILENLDFTHIRLVYTASSGTGTLNAVLTAKQVGG